MNDDFKKVLDCPGLIFVKDRNSVDELDSTKISNNGIEPLKAVLKGDDKAVYKNDDVKQALATMRKLSQLFTTNTKSHTIRGYEFSQNSIETVALLGVHDHAFGKRYSDEKVYQKTLSTKEKEKLLIFGNNAQATRESAWIPEGGDFDLTMLIAWSYALLRWYGEYGTEKEWTHTEMGFVDWVATKSPSYFDRSKNIRTVFDSGATTKDNTVTMNSLSYVGKNKGFGAVPSVPIKRNQQDKDKQLPKDNYYWVPDIVSLQIQGLTPNYSPFGIYNSAAKTNNAYAKVNHWWYRREYWGRHKLLGIEPGNYGNETTGPWRPLELQGLVFKKDSEMEMPLTYFNAENFCGTAKNVGNSATAKPKAWASKGGAGVYEADGGWTAQANSAYEHFKGNNTHGKDLDTKGTYVWRNEEPYRYLGKFEPHIHLAFPEPKTWKRDMDIPTSVFVGTKGQTINAEMFQYGTESGSKFINVTRHLGDREILPMFEAFPAPKLNKSNDFGDDLESYSKALKKDGKSPRFVYGQFNAPNGLMGLLRSTTSTVWQSNGATRGPHSSWWQYKWEHAIRAADFNAKNGNNATGVNLAYGSLLNPYFGVQFCGPNNKAFRTIFVLVAQVVSLFDKIGDKLDFKKMKDLLCFNSNNVNDKSRIWENYIFLQAFVTRIILNSRLEYEEIIKTRENNKRIAEADPGSVAMGDQEIRTRLQDNAQCVLINAVNLFNEKRKTDKAYQGTLNDPAFYNTVHGDCSAFINLLGFKKDVIKTFMNLKTNQAALLQPRIRLFKQRTNPTSGGSDWITVDVAGPFETGLNKKAVRNILEGGGGRLPGSGIKEIYMEQRDGNASVNLVETKDVEITFHFNSLEEIFLNYPVYKGDSKEPPSYPYGISQGASKKADGTLSVASVAELVFPITPGITTGEFMLQDFDNRASPDFRVILELGWSMPGSLFDNFSSAGRGAKNFIKEIQKQNPYQSVVLMPYDSEFTITQNGLVELKVKYRGIEESVMTAPKNRLFPSAASLLAKLEGDEANIPEGLKGIAKELKEHISTVKKLKEKQKKGKDSILTDDERTTLKESQAKVGALLGQAQEKQFENFLDKDIQGLYSALIDSGMYHRIAIPSALLGKVNKFTDSRTGKTQAGVTKFNPSRATGDLADFKINPADKATGTNSLDNLKKQGAERSAEAKKKAHEANTDRHKDGENKGELDKSNDTTVSAEWAKLRDNFPNQTGDGFSEPVDFMYFGDILYVIYQRLEDGANIAAAPGKGMEAARAFRNEKLTFILGSIKMPVTYNERLEYHDINIGDIPVNMTVFNRFLVDYVIAKKNYNVSYADFIIAFYKFFMNKYFSQACFGVGVGADSFSPEIKFFEMFKETKKNDAKGFVFPPFTTTAVSANVGEVSNRYTKLGSSPQVFMNKEQVKKRMLAYETRIKTGLGKNYNTHPYFSYCYLGGQTVGSQYHNWSDDLANNIHHFFIGRDRGIVKNIDFSSRDLKGRAESAYFSSNVLEKGMFMIPRVYDVTVTMMGNNFFQSGQTFYVDPTIGTRLSVNKNQGGKGLDIIKNSGLGGYYYTNKVITTIRAGKYETSMEGIKVILTRNESRKKQAHQPATADEIKKLNKHQKRLKDKK